MTAQPTLPKGQIDSHDTSQVYVHREPSALRKALPWVVLAVIALGLIYLGVVLWQSMQGRAPSFTIYTVKGGWITFLLFLLAATGVLALTSFIGQKLGQRTTGRTISYWAVLGDQLTHLFLILVVLIAIYPLIYVLLAAFDPKNSLFAFPDFSNPNIFYRSGILPKLSGLTFENFGKLFDGVTIPLWQTLLAVVVGAALASLLVLNISERSRGASASIDRYRSLAIRVLIGALIVLVVFMVPTQFQGQELTLVALPLELRGHHEHHQHDQRADRAGGVHGAHAVPGAGQRE